MKKTLFILLCLSPVVTGFGQEINRTSMRLPQEILGYQVLKCDFHLHTIFSDGMVWPTVRVDEAIAEGIDAISITDHIESRPRMKGIGVENLSHSIAYDIAKSNAQAAGVILIPAVEITKEAPPGHFNALFVQDADRFEQTYNHNNPRDGGYIRESLQEARKQGAFIFWNHPWYQIPGTLSIWHPIIDSLHKEGYIDGIEVINGTKYDPVILGWVQSKSLANIANTDLHTPSVFGGDHFRTMTLVFAKERSAQGIREALDNRRSVSYSEGNLYGDQKFLEELFHKSIEIQATCNGNNGGALVIKNTSSITYKISFIDTDLLRISSYSGGLTIPGLGDTAASVSYQAGFAAKRSFKVKVLVANLEVAPGVALETTLDVVF